MPSRPSLAPRALDVAHQRIDAVVVEAQAVDDRAVLRQPEHARLRIARLRLRRHRADLDEAEAQREQRIDVRAVLVEAGGQADRIRERQPERLGRQRLRPAGQQRIEPAAVSRFQRRQPERVRALGVELEQERAGESVHRSISDPRRFLPVIPARGSPVTFLSTNAKGTGFPLPRG